MLPVCNKGYKECKMREHNKSPAHARLKRRQQRIDQLEAVVERQAGEIAHLVQQLRSSAARVPGGQR